VVDITGGGPFTLGSDSMAYGASTAQPGVSVGRFALDRYEVTVARFRRYWEAGHPGVTGGVLYPGETTAGVNVPWNGPVVDPVVRNPGAASPNEWQRFCNWTVSATDRESHPINCVDWYTAQAFCVWDGGLLSTNGQTGRLPTEAEWEFAARGTEGRPWPWGTTMIASQACWNRCPTYPTDCLGTCVEEDAAFAAGATPAGVRHMVGNVWEWTADNYGPYSTTTSSDPCINRSGRQNPICNNSATGGRVIRGGSWSIFDVVANLRSASRDVIGAPVYRNDNRGFRCAGTLTE
jgi:formylglycine-generating enzyme required for sulfatase activity